MRKRKYFFMIVIILVVFLGSVLYYFINLNTKQTDLETLLSNFDYTQLCESLKSETIININGSDLQISSTAQTTTLEISGEKYDISLEELEEFCLNN